MGSAGGLVRVRTVQIPDGLLHALEEQARGGYPEETCGFLFSPEIAERAPVRIVCAVEAVPNVAEEERQRRFVIAAEALRAAEARAASRREVVCGFYHSHPDSPAVPSAFDTDHAWPWYTYLVTSVDPAGVGGAGAFELDATRQRFQACELEVAPGPGPGPGG